jgi:hypothetical protein
MSTNINLNSIVELYNLFAPTMHKTVVQKNAERLVRILENKPQGQDMELLLPSNKVSREIYEKITGTKLPNSKKKIFNIGQ